MASIPSEMFAIQLIAPAPSPYNQWRADSLSEFIIVKKVEVPKPRFGQVLIKMERSVINPSDLSTLVGQYNPESQPNIPYIPGREGSGTVVSSGGGFMSWSLLGKRVALSGDHLWAEYAAVDATNCLPIPADVSFEEGSAAFVNPLTVLALVEISVTGGHKTILHTAAASALGKMLIKHAKNNGVSVICVVRKEEQIKECIDAGATLVLSTSEPDFESKLKEMTANHNCRLGFDAVSGDLTGTILSAMPNGSEIQIYGGLSGKPVGNVSPTELIFKGKKLCGFWLLPYLQSKYKVGLYLWTKRVAGLLKKDFATKVAKQFELKEVAQALEYYVHNMTAGKTLFICSNKQ